MNHIESRLENNPYSQQHDRAKNRILTGMFIYSSKNKIHLLTSQFDPFLIKISFASSLMFVLTFASGVFLTQWSGHRVWLTLYLTSSGLQFDSLLHKLPFLSYSKIIASKASFLKNKTLINLTTILLSHILWHDNSLLKSCY